MATDNSFDISGESNLPDKITALKNLAKSYDMKMQGYKLETSNDKWVISGKALAGKDFIALSTGIISSFAENANLMTGKTAEKFMMEFADAFYRVNVMILNSKDVKQENYRAVIKMFKDTLSNVGDIITVSRNTLKQIFKQYDLTESNSDFD